jgi:hypothetical protein
MEWQLFAGVPQEDVRRFCGQVERRRQESYDSRVSAGVLGSGAGANCGSVIVLGRRPRW